MQFWTIRHSWYINPSNLLAQLEYESVRKTTLDFINNVALNSATTK